MQQRRLFGVPSIPLSEAIDNLMALQGNAKRSHYTKYLIAAKWIWKHMLRHSIWNIRQVYVDVNPDGTINMPADVDMLYNISVVDDCNRLHALSYNSNINTVKLAAHSKVCSCNTCKGAGTLCDLFDKITMRTEAVEIDGTTYHKRIYNQRTGATIYEVTETPRLKVGTGGNPSQVGHVPDTVEYITERRTICQVEVTDKGCICESVANRDLITEHLGCFILACQKELCDNSVLARDNANGHWREDAQVPNLIHLQGVNATRVVLTYLGTAEDLFGSEVMVPEYAVMAFHFGVYWYSSAFDPKESDSSKERNERKYLARLSEMRRFLDPIRVSDFMSLGSIVGKWG